jgi:hypothetical protein
MANKIYYPSYDIYVNSETGEIPLPICKCTEDDCCVFMENWINDGKPTRIPKNELDVLNSLDNGEYGDPFIFT